MDAILTKSKVPTSILKELVKRAIKGSTMIDVIPLTCLMGISVKENKLTIRTTDNINFVTVFSEVEAPDFEVVVESKKFATLVDKLSSEYTTFIVNDTKLTLETDSGQYHFSLAVEEDGSKIQLPEKTFTANGGSVNVSLEELKSVLSFNRACKADGKDSPALYNYYFDNEQVFTTDNAKACRNPLVFSDRPMVLSPAVLDLVLSVVDEKYGVDITQDETNIMFSSPIGTLVAKKGVQADLDMFPVNPCKQVFTRDMDYMTKLSKYQLTSALDRMTLFTDPLDQNVLTLIFNKDGVTLLDENSDSKETIKYIVEKEEEKLPDFEPISLKLDVKCLMQELSAYSKEKVDIGFTDEVGILFVCDKVRLLLGVLTQDQQY